MPPGRHSHVRIPKNRRKPAAATRENRPEAPRSGDTWPRRPRKAARPARARPAPRGFVGWPCRNLYPPPYKSMRLVVWWWREKRKGHRTRPFLSHHPSPPPTTAHHRYGPAPEDCGAQHYATRRDSAAGTTGAALARRDAGRIGCRGFGAKGGQGKNPSHGG